VVGLLGENSNHTFAAHEVELVRRYIRTAEAEMFGKHAGTNHAESVEEESHDVLDDGCVITEDTHKVVEDVEVELILGVEGEINHDEREAPRPSRTASHRGRNYPQGDANSLIQMVHPHVRVLKVAIAFSAFLLIELHALE